MDRHWNPSAFEKSRRWPISNHKKARIHRIRGKEYMALANVQIPILYFNPDTPKKVVWLAPT